MKVKVRVVTSACAFLFSPPDMWFIQQGKSGICLNLSGSRITCVGRLVGTSAALSLAVSVTLACRMDGQNNEKCTRVK